MPVEALFGEYDGDDVNDEDARPLTGSLMIGVGVPLPEEPAGGVPVVSRYIGRPYSDASLITFSW